MLLEFFSLTPATNDKQVRIMSAPAAKKQKKCAATFSVLPADNEVNLEDVRTKVRGIEKEGLVWGQGNIEPFVFGLEKLVISAYVFSLFSRFSFSQLLCYGPRERQ